MKNETDDASFFVDCATAVFCAHDHERSGLKGVIYTYLSAMERFFEDCHELVELEPGADGPIRELCLRQDTSWDECLRRGHTYVD